ncbi:MAG: hypothetical protein KKD74_09600 [Bacteroidetes bacterium]|nr:hypothetical protein [Bacteroidota bacterium]
MKTQILLIAALLSLTVSTSSHADEFKQKEEAYIDDIPFNTDSIAADYLLGELLNDTIKLSEEAYVDDIPFDTHEVVLTYHSDSAMQVNFVMESEAPIDDIPFNTSEVLNAYMKWAGTMALTKKNS